MGHLPREGRSQSEWKNAEEKMMEMKKPLECSFDWMLRGKEGDLWPNTLRRVRPRITEIVMGRFVAVAWHLFPKDLKSSLEEGIEWSWQIQPIWTKAFCKLVSKRVRKTPWRKKWQPIPIFLPGKSHGQKEPDRLQSTELQRVGHNLATKQQ